MFTRALSLSLLLTFAPGAGFTQEVTKKAPDNEAEVLFANGSLVRMVVVQETLEVDTRYGKLIIPCKDIRRVDFGVHLPEGTEQKLDAAFKKLGSAQFKERDAAVNELVGLGPYAYPALTAHRSSSPEVTQRLAIALQRIRAKVPESQLRLREDDVIVTPTFTIVGRILTQSIKVKAEYFGDLQLSLAGLRTLRCLGSTGESEFSVEANKFGSNPNQWLDTGFVVDGVSQLTVEAGGQVDLWPQGPGQYVSAPKGYPQAGKRGNHYAGTLIGRIGENGEPFIIGDRFQAVPGREGKLYLHIVPSPWQNESAGSYQVRVSASFVGRGQ
jgi:hypothetical protein